MAHVSTEAFSAGGGMQRQDDGQGWYPPPQRQPLRAQNSAPTLRDEAKLSTNVPYRPSSNLADAAAMRTSPYSAQPQRPPPQQRQQQQQQQQPPLNSAPQMGRPPPRMSSRAPGPPNAPPLQRIDTSQRPPPRKQSLSATSSPRKSSAAAAAAAATASSRPTFPTAGPPRSPITPMSPSPGKQPFPNGRPNPSRPPARPGNGRPPPSYPGPRPRDNSLPSQSRTDPRRPAMRSATDPVPRRSQSARTSSVSPMRQPPPFAQTAAMVSARDSARSAMTAGSSIPDITTMTTTTTTTPDTIFTPENPSMKTAAGPLGGYDVTMRKPENLALQKEKSSEDISVEDVYNMYTDEFRNSPGTGVGEIPRPAPAPTLAELRQQEENMPTPKLPSLNALDHQSTSVPKGLADPGQRTSAEIMAGQYESRAVTSTANTNPAMALSSVAPRDRYGFKKENQFIRLAQYDSWNAYYSKYLDRRRAKWNELMKQFNLSIDSPTHFPPRSDKVKRYVRKGIPPEWRGAAWFYYAGGPSKMAASPGLYNTLAAKADKGELPDADKEHIERDLHRTFPDNIRFKPEAPPSEPRDSKLNSNNGHPSGSAFTAVAESPMIESLRRVLRAFALHHPRMGYCQSLNFLAGQALLFLDGDEERAFHLLCILTSEHLPGTHGLALEGANVDIGVLMATLREALPIMWAKMDDRQDISLEIRRADMRLATALPTVSLATTAWFMSCFVGTLPVETTCRVWDCLFYEGSKTLFRVALGIFKLGEREIMRLADNMEVFQMVQTLPRTLLDANALMEGAFGRGMEGRGLLSQETVEKRRQERRQLYRNERERFASGTGGAGGAALSRVTTGGASGGAGAGAGVGGDSGGEDGKKPGRAKSTLKRFKSRRNRDS